MGEQTTGKPVQVHDNTGNRRLTPIRGGGGGGKETPEGGL